VNDSSVIKDAITLSEVIGKDVRLRRSSSNPNRWIGLCPFHNEKNPSFCVDDSWGRYRCFSCLAKGDVLQYLQDIYGLDFKEAVSRAKAIAGIVDEYLTPAQRKYQEWKMKAVAQEKNNFRNWRTELRQNLILYTSLEWEIYRKARRQMMDTWTEELEQQAELAFSEAVRKEAALDEFESMTDEELMGFYRSRKSWEGVANPSWFLSGRRLEIVKKAKGA